MTNKEILKLKFYSDDLGKEISIKKYLKKLLKKVILETEGFDGKRPFGNSDWIYELAYCLCENEIIENVPIEGEDGYYDFDYDEFEKKMIELIDEI